MPLLSLHNITAAFGAFAVNKLTFCPEGFTGCTVFAHIFTLVNIPPVIKLLKNLLYGFNMVIVSCADISVIADIHILPKILEYFNNVVNIFLWGYSLFLCLLLYFKTVLVGACKEYNVLALHTSESCN